MLLTRTKRKSLQRQIQTTRKLAGRNTKRDNTRPYQLLQRFIFYCPHAIYRLNFKLRTGQQVTYFHPIVLVCT